MGGGGAETIYLLFKFERKLIETEATTWSEFPNGRKTTVEFILVSVEMNTSKRGGLWESQLGIQVGKLTMWIRLFELEN